MSINTYDIIIIGAGPVGCVAALLAHQCGLSVAIVEKKTKDSYRGNAHYLNAYSLECLNQCGIDIASLLSKLSHRESEFSMSFGYNLEKIIKRVNLLDNPVIKERYRKIGEFGGACNIPLNRLYEELIRKIQLKKIPVFWNFSIKKIDKCKNIIHTDQSQIEKLHFDYLLACDGSNSMVRESLKLHADKKHFLEFINVELESDVSYLEEKSQLYWLYNPFAIGCWVMHDFSFHQNIQIPILPVYQKSEIIKRESINKIIQSMIGRSIDYNIKNYNTWHVQTIITNRFVKDNIFFLGDSAHTCTPAGGLGLNLGIHDSANLIWKLAARKMERKTSLSSYHEERFKIAKQTVKKSEKNYSDFKKIATCFSLPNINHDTYIPNIISHLFSNPCTQFFSSWFYKNTVFGLFKNITLKKLDRALNETIKHFDGMDFHVGYNIYNGKFKTPLIFDESVKSLENCFEIGRIWFNQHIINKDGCLIKEIFYYGKWQIYIFSSEEKFMNKKDKKHFDYHFFIGIDFFLKDNITNYENKCLVIRPDRIIEYFGDIDEYYS